MNASEFDFLGCATALEACLPQNAPSEEHAPGSSLYAKVVALIEAVKSKDLDAIGRAVYGLLGFFYGDESPNGGIEFQAMALRKGIDWNRILGVIETLLPIVIGSLKG